MTDIIEKNEFISNVPLIETGDKVEGGVSGSANKQGIVLTARTRYLKNESDKTNQTIANLTADKVGADAKGTAVNLLQSHELDADPHSQYLTKADAILQYLELSQGNLPNGYLQLDSQGKIPAALLSLISTEYIVVADEPARLALSSNPNLIIVAQADIDTLFYLNGGLDPAVSSNWVRGQAATVNGVSRVFGRTGDIVAELGDYTADLIAETASRLFVGPSEKTTWNNKQEKLVSGSNIKTLFGVSLLGLGDLVLTPDQLGSASKVHTHTVDQISDFRTKVLELIGTHLKPGKGITIGYDSVVGDTTISGSGGGGSGGDIDYIVIERLGSVANQIHTFSFAPQTAFNLTAYALKSEAGKSNQSYSQDSFPVTAPANFKATSDLVFSNSLSPKINDVLTMIANGSLFEGEVTVKGKKLVIASDASSSVVPPMTAATQDGYTVAMSSGYDASVKPFSAFDNNPSTVWISLNQPSTQAPQWLRATLPKAVQVTRYSIINRAAGFINSPTTWVLQGSNNGGASWTVLDTRTSNDNAAGKVRTFTVTNPGSYTTYQLNVTGSAIAGALTIAELQLLGGENNKFLLHSGENYYTVNASNDLEQVTNPITLANIIAKGVTSATLTEAMQNQLGSNYKVVIGENFNVKTNLTPYAQIALNKSLTGAAKWDKINSATITQTLVGAGVSRFAVTRDLSEYFIFNGTAWVSIGTLTADKTGADKLIAQGMTAVVLNAITQVQWTSFYTNNANVLDNMAFAYALDITDGVTDNVTITSNVLNVNEVGSWKLQTPAEVEVRWYSDGVSFKTIAAGDYKLGYQIP